MKNNIKYLDDYTDVVTEYIGKVILEVFHGVAKNIGIKNPDKFSKKQPIIQKAFEGVNFNPKRKHKYLYDKNIMRRRIFPFSIDRKIYKKGKFLNFSDWRRFEKEIINYMTPYFDNIHEEISVRGVLLSIASAEAEAQQEHIEKYGMKSLEQIDKEIYKNKMPQTFKEYEKSEHYDRAIEKPMMQVYNNTAIHIQNIKDDVRDAIRQQVISAHKAGKTPQQLASDLYWMKDENPELKKYTAESLLRDWQRVASTELAMIHAAGKLAYNENEALKSMKNPAAAVYVMFTGGTCEWCRSHQGIIMRQIPLEFVGSENDDTLLSRGIEDPHTNIAVWQGKNNVGYKKAQWRVCTPAHPWNSAQLVRINPDIQEYDKKTGRISYKSSQKLKNYIPDEFRKETEKLRDKISKRDAKKETERKKNIHRKPIEHIERRGNIVGTDNQGRKIAEDDGQSYVAVNPSDFSKELEAWRKDTTRPVPVATNQREYKSIFGA